MLETVLLSTILLSDTVTTDKTQNLDEVVIVSETGRGRKRSVKGQVASIDEHLTQLLGDTPERNAMLAGYRRLSERLGTDVCTATAARLIVENTI